MAESVLADATSVRAVEEFLSGELGREVALGEVTLVCGRLGALVARGAGAGGVTIGRRIFLARWLGARVLERCDAMGRLPSGGALEALGALFVHECVHVAQYQDDGTAQFLSKYLLSYFSSIYMMQSLRRAARSDAYRAIPQETEAYECERAWRERGCPSARVETADRSDSSS